MTFQTKINPVVLKELRIIGTILDDIEDMLSV